MKEYFGKSSKVYQQTRGKRFILIPAIKRHLDTAEGNKTLLDVACGIGDLSELAHTKGYTYYGLDVSKDMISRAKEAYPDGQFLVASATSFANKYNHKFDVILISMLFPTFNKIADIIKVLKECKAVLKKGGQIIIGEPYPAFDGYMQSNLLGRNDVKTKFNGYFASGIPVAVTHKLPKGKLTFNDYHHTLSEYFEAINKAGLQVSILDECPPGKEAKAFDKSFYKERGRFPTYLLLVCK